MHKKILVISLMVAVLAALLPAAGLAAPAAQSNNLLTNPGFEEPYEDVNRGRRAAGWRQWYEDTGHESADVFRVEIELNPALVQEGRSSQHIGNRTFAWHAGMIQSLAVPAGTPVRFCAYGRVYVSNDDFEEAEGWSWDGFRSQMKVGIHPNGDVAWSDPGIIWSAEANPHTAWQQMCVEAQVGNTGQVTVLTSNDFRAAADAEGALAYHVDAWWDNASLVATAPPATAAPTTGANPPPAQAPTVAASGCRSRPDGSVVYVVQLNDTLFAIALACDSTVEEIQRLNGLTSTLISVGQTLVVKAAPGATAPTPAATQPPAAQPTATLAATTEITATSPAETPAPTQEPTLATSDGQVCVEAFNDANANRAKDGGEQLLGGVGFTLSDAAGPKGSYVTSGLEPEPYCFAGLQPGSYTLEARSPVGVANTTELQWRIGLTAGMKFSAQYGGSRAESAPGEVDAAQPGAEAANEPTEQSSGGGGSSLGRIVLGVLGVAILVAAGFTANLVWTRARR